jgi:hypothetical protein
MIAPDCRCDYAPRLYTLSEATTGKISSQTGGQTEST